MTTKQISTFAGTGLSFNESTRQFDLDLTYVRPPHTTSLSPAVNHTCRVDCSTSAKTVLLPSSHQVGDKITIKMVSAATYTCTISPFGSQTIDDEASLILTIDYEWAVLESDGANWMVVG